MILQALTEYYQVLYRQGKDRRPGVEPGQGDVRPVYWGRWKPGTGHRHPDRAGSGEKDCAGSSNALSPGTCEAVQRRGRQLSL